MSSRKIEDLHPAMQPIVRDFLNQADEILGSWQAFITDGFRSNEEQTQLYAQGRTIPGKIVTYAQAGESAHNYGLAIDIAFRMDGTKDAQWIFEKYRELTLLAEKLGLVWGGIWTDFRDNPHYEFKNWKQLINKKEPMPIQPSELMQIEQHDFEKLVKNSTTLDQLCEAMGLPKNSDMQAISDLWAKHKQAIKDNQDKKYSDDATQKIEVHEQYTRGKLAGALKVGPGETLEDLIYMVKDLKDQSNQPKKQKRTPKVQVLTSPSKNWMKSKTIWFNLVMTVINCAAFITTMATQVPESFVLYAVMVQGFGNIVLRTWFTESKISNEVSK